MHAICLLHTVIVLWIYLINYDIILFCISQSSGSIHIEYECEVEKIYTQQDFMMSDLSKENSKLGYYIHITLHSS